MNHCNSQAFEVLHFTEGIRLNGANGVVSQVPVGTLHIVSLTVNNTLKQYIDTHTLKKQTQTETYIQVLISRHLTLTNVQIYACLWIHASFSFPPSPYLTNACERAYRNSISSAELTIC